MKEFFEWLKEINKLDEYEAMLDIAIDYAGDQKYRLKACEEIEKLKLQYKNK